MKHITLIGDAKLLRHFLSRLKKHQQPFPPLCFKIGEEEVRLSVANARTKIENNALAVIWFLSDKDKKTNQQCVEMIKQLPREVHLDSYFADDHEEPHSYLHSLLKCLPQIEKQRKAVYEKNAHQHFSLTVFYKWGASLFMAKSKTKNEKLDVESSAEFKQFVHNK